MAEWIPIIVSVVAVFVSVFAAAREYRFGKPDALAKYEAVVTDLLERVERLEADNNRLEVENAANKRRIRELDDELEDYRLGVVILVTQMEGAGLSPKWRPREKRNTGELKAK